MILSLLIVSTHRGNKCVRRPPLHQITNVDDHRARDGRRLDEVPLARAHLQPSSVILEQNRQRSVVCVLAAPQLVAFPVWMTTTLNFCTSVYLWVLCVWQ